MSPTKMSPDQSKPSSSIRPSRREAAAGELDDVGAQDDDEGREDDEDEDDDDDDDDRFCSESSSALSSTVNCNVERLVAVAGVARCESRRSSGTRAGQCAADTGGRGAASAHRDRVVDPTATCANINRIGNCCMAPMPHCDNLLRQSVAHTALMASPRSGLPPVHRRDEPSRVARRHASFPCVSKGHTFRMHRSLTRFDS